MKVLAWLGARSGAVMLCGLIIAVLVPAPEVLANSLPIWVMGLIAVAVARMKPLSRASMNKSVLWRALALIALLPISCIAVVWLWRGVGLPEVYVLPLIAFLAAPPISGAANLCLILGYNARLALMATVIATLATPIIAVLCVVALGVELETNVAALALKVSTIVGGGIVLGLLLLRFGQGWVAAHGTALDGVSALLMVAFLFPVFDGAIALGVAQPGLAVGMAGLAFTLNLGGHLLVRHFVNRAAGLCFGNRNTGLYLAILPFEPGLSLFVALYQIPMYLTPLLFRRLDR